MVYISNLKFRSTGLFQFEMYFINKLIAFIRIYHTISTNNSTNNSIIWKASRDVMGSSVSVSTEELPAEISFGKTLLMRRWRTVLLHCLLLLSLGVGSLESRLNLPCHFPGSVPPTHHALHSLHDAQFAAARWLDQPRTGTSIAQPRASCPKEDLRILWRPPRSHKISKASTVNSLSWQPSVNT